MDCNQRGEIQWYSIISLWYIFMPILDGRMEVQVMGDCHHFKCKHVCIKKIVQIQNWKMNETFKISTCSLLKVTIIHLQGRLLEPGIFPNVLTSSLILTSIRLIDFSINPFLTSSNPIPNFESQIGIDKTIRILQMKFIGS